MKETTKKVLNVINQIGMENHKWNVEIRETLVQHYTAKDVDDTIIEPHIAIWEDEDTKFYFGELLEQVDMVIPMGEDGWIYIYYLD